MTIFVGPNNSGKSLALREIKNMADNGPGVKTLIIDEIVVDWPSIEDAIGALKRRATETQPPGLTKDHLQIIKLNPSKGAADEVVVDLHGISEFLGMHRSGGVVDPPILQYLHREFLSRFTIDLDGPTRFQLTESRKAGDLLLHPSNHIAALFRDDALRMKVRTLVMDCIRLSFVIDPTLLGQLRIRLSTRPPHVPAEEQGLDAQAREFHANAVDIRDTSDGVKAIVGLISALVLPDFKIAVVDEPEAFLHPPLARKLGMIMARLSRERSASFWVATHSPQFLMGCIESGSGINIVRLTNGTEGPRARALPKAKIDVLMRDPLLRSAGVLTALFHSAAVVCEADADRAFYDEVNMRLISHGRVGVSDAVFLNAQNKQTIRRIVGPLREMGVPAAVIVDIDVIKGESLRDLLSACGVPQGIAEAIGQLRGRVESYFRQRGLEMKDGGIGLLSGPEKESAESLIAQAMEYGIFIVPNGELEQWLPALIPSGPKSLWLDRAFSAFGSDPEAANYIKPADGDVWGFVERIGGWVSDPRRKGVAN